jgi:hypothetical protein
MIPVRFERIAIQRIAVERIAVGTKPTQQFARGSKHRDVKLGQAAIEA